MKKVDYKSKVRMVEEFKVEIEKEEPLEKKEAKKSAEQTEEDDEEKEEIEKEEAEAKKEETMTKEEKKEQEQSCEFGCANQMQGRFNKLSIKFKKLSDAVEKDALTYKFDSDKFESLKKGYKEAVSFVRAEERKLKKEEGLKDLDANDKTEFLAA